MTLKEKILFGAAVVVVAIAGVFAVNALNNQHSFGALSGMLAENYDPYLRNNGGYNSALPIQTSSTFQAASSVITGVATFVGQVIQTGGAAAIAVFPGTLITNNVIQASGGYAQTLTANTTVTVPQWCAGTAILIASSTAAAFTITLPAATSTYATCGGVTGAWSQQIIDNESSYNITLATTTGGNGIRFFMATGTPASGATYPPFIAASSTVTFTGQYVSTSTLNAYMASYYRPFGNGS